MYRSNDSCCDEITWVKPHVLVSVDDYNVKTLSPAAVWFGSRASPTSRSPMAAARLPGTPPVEGTSPKLWKSSRLAVSYCRAVPHRPNQDDSSPIFSRDDKALIVVRQHFDLKLGYAVGQSKLVTIPLSALTPVKTC